MKPYRGKSKDKDKRWIYGWYSYNSKRDIHMITEDNNGTWLVNGETVGQQVGLVDTKNKDFYKGDIFRVTLEAGECWEFVVHWDKRCAAWYALPRNWKITEPQYPLHYYTDNINKNKVEIIGNIHTENQNGKEENQKEEETR
ncbi:MAG: YopX family protein [Methylococcaceae bacterium]